MASWASEMVCLEKLVDVERWRYWIWHRLKFVGGIGYICIGFRLIGWLQKVDWEKKSREEEEEDEEDEEDW